MPHFPGLAALRVEPSLDLDRQELGQGLVAHNFTLVSQSHGLLANLNSAPGSLLTGPTNQDPAYFSLYHQPDLAIEENRVFRYSLIRPAGETPTQNLIIMVHGFNERGWAKYLPWAGQLVKRTGQAVLLFPMAFHMNRSPKLWNDPRAMKKVSSERQKLYPEVRLSTLSNAAISVRMHANPARFFWSGLVSYHDLLDLIRGLRAGQLPLVAPEAKLGFFAYSIGAFLAEIVFFANEEGLLSDARLVAFCGGPVFNRLSPVTKFIIDSEANDQLYSFLVERLESHQQTDPELSRFLADDSLAGRNFRCLLNNQVDRLYREERLRTLTKRVLALALTQDEVVPPAEIIATLRGGQGDLDLPVEVLDPPYPYRHEDPFPATGPHQAPAEAWLDKTFELAADFLA